MQVVPDYGTLFLIIQVCDTVTSCAIAVVTQALLGIAETECCVHIGLTVVIRCADTSVYQQNYAGTDQVFRCRHRRRLQSPTSVFACRRREPQLTSTRFSTSANKFVAMVLVFATWLVYLRDSSIPTMPVTSF